MGGCRELCGWCPFARWVRWCVRRLRSLAWAARWRSPSRKVARRPAWQRVGELCVAGSVGWGGFHVEWFEFGTRFQVAENSRLIITSMVIPSLFVAKWQYVLKWLQLQNRLRLGLVACWFSRGCSTTCRFSWRRRRLCLGSSLSVVR